MNKYSKMSIILLTIFYKFTFIICLQINIFKIRKLKQLTLLSLASNQKRISCLDLQKALCIDSLRELEDLIIDLIYTDALKGKMDQRAETLEVEYTLGRDIKPEQVRNLIKMLIQSM